VFNHDKNSVRHGSYDSATLAEQNSKCLTMVKNSVWHGSYDSALSEVLENNATIITQW
jgi:hypothetical protein